jgi:hypothetical protein
LEAETFQGKSTFSAVTVSRSRWDNEVDST